MPTVDELLKMTEGVTAKQDALQKLADTQVTGTQFREKGQKWHEPLTGRGTAAQTQAMLAMLSNPRKEGQTGMQALGEGFNKGMALRDNIMEKEHGRKVNAAKLGVQGAQDTLKNQAEIYGMQEKARKDAYNVTKEEEETAYQRSRDKIEDEQWTKELETDGAAKVFASQVKEHAAVSTELFQSERNASQAEMLAQDMSGYASQAPGGLRAQVGTLFKDNAGLRDQVSSLRTRANAIINTQVINNLPPGVASDRDIELARKGFPNPDTATLGELQEFAKAVANIERGNSMYLREKSAYMDANNYSILGFQKEWDAKRAAALKEQGAPNVPSQAPVAPVASPAPTLAPGGTYTYDPATGGFK